MDWAWDRRSTTRNGEGRGLLNENNKQQEARAAAGPLPWCIPIFFKKCIQLYVIPFLFLLFLQQALRLLAFRQIHKILGMEPLPTSKASTRNRKRRLDGSNTGEGEGEGKKDKKEEADSAWPLLQPALLKRLVECPNEKTKNNLDMQLHTI